MSISLVTIGQKSIYLQKMSKQSKIKIECKMMTAFIEYPKGKG
jgi:hypothetical protein